MTQSSSSWPIPPPLKQLIQTAWRDQGVTCNDAQWQRFKQKIEPYIGPEGRWALPKQTLGSRIQALTMPERGANTVRNYFGAQNPLPKDYVAVIQGACLTATWFESAPEPIQTEAIYQLINHLPGVERGRLRGWLGRPQVRTLGQRVALPAAIDAINELRPELIVWPLGAGQTVPTQRAGLVGGSAAERRLQLSLICEQDPVHVTFCAVVIDDLRTEKDLTRLTETVRGLETGNPAKPALLLLAVFASGDVAQTLQKFLAEHAPTASVVFVMEDAASVDVFGIAPDHIAKLPTIDIELPKQPPAKVAQTNQPVVEPSVGAASQTIAPEPITQPATPELRQAVASPPPKQLPVGPPPLTRDELETLIQLSRSLEPDLAFSRQSLAFAMGQSPDAAERLMRRWLQHGVVIPAGRAHDIEVFVVPDAIRRDIADLVMQQPELSRPPLIDFGQMPAQLSALSPISPPYQGTKLAAQFDVAPTPSISAWSADIISKAYKLGSLEATRQILRAHQKLLVVDLLPTVVALEHRTVYWRRVFIIAVTALILAGILTGLFVALTRATDWGLFLAVILALGLLATMVIWAINHQIARAWLRLWGEMGLK